MAAMSKQLLATISSAVFVLANAPAPPRAPAPSPTGSRLGDSFYAVHSAYYGFSFCDRSVGFEIVNDKLNQLKTRLAREASFAGKGSIARNAELRFRGVTRVMSPPFIRCEGGLTHQKELVLAAIARAQSELRR